MEVVTKLNLFLLLEKEFFWGSAWFEISFNSVWSFAQKFVPERLAVQLLVRKIWKGFGTNAPVEINI